MTSGGAGDGGVVIEAPGAVGTLPMRQKYYFAAAFLGAWGPLSVWNTHRTTLFVIYFQADVAAMGIVQILAAVIDALNGPFVAHLADSAAINRWLPRFFPLATWGRRAPLMALGAPLMLAGPTLMWLRPSPDLTTIWYALCFFLFVNGNTITLQSYLASIQELFSTGTERAVAIVRQTPFMVVTYALAGAPLLIAFTTNPDTGTRCCVDERAECADERAGVAAARRRRERGGRGAGGLEAPIGDAHSSRTSS